MPFYPFLGEGSPTKADYRKTGTLILTSLLEDLVWLPFTRDANPGRDFGATICEVPKCTASFLKVANKRQANMTVGYLGVSPNRGASLL